MRRYIFLSLILIGSLIGRSQSIIYVNIKAKGSNDGTSWTNACIDLQTAINKASQNGASVWVAQGTYIPTTDSLGKKPSSNRDACFTLKNNVIIYGGFKGSESRFTLRDPAKHQVILSGEIGDTTILTDNLHHIVYSRINTSNTAGLDGVLIINGQSDKYNGAGAFLGGGTIKNCTFSNNAAINGGALFSRQTFISNCEFKFNTAKQNGGALFCISTQLDSCIIRNNNANIGGGVFLKSGNANYNKIYNNTANSQGGGIYSFGSILSGNRIINNKAKDGGGLFKTDNSPTVNCIITNNFASDNGGGIYSDNGGTFTNNTICQNKCNINGGGIYCNGSITVINTVFWKNSTKNIYCNNINSTFSNVAISDSSKVSGSNTNVFKLNENNPIFAQQVDSSGSIITTNGLLYAIKTSWQPAEYSQLTDAGDNSFMTQYPLDVNMKNRIINSPRYLYENNQVAQIDIGAAEGKSSLKLNSSHIFYVSEQWRGTGDGSSWENATSDLNNLFTYINNNYLPSDIQIWVQQGTYYPSNDPKIGLSINKKVMIYGGFAGNETILEQRDWINHPTTISGDIGTILDVNDNIETILKISQATIDGFIIYNAKFRGVEASYAVVRNCEIMYNGPNKNVASNPLIYGAGIYSYHSNIETCRIHNNKSKNGSGGGIYSISGTLSNSKIYNNESTDNNGGGAYLISSAMTDCSVYECSVVASKNSYISGGGVFCQNSTIDNCEIYRNTSGYVAGGVRLTLNSFIRNSKISENDASSSGGGVLSDNDSYIIKCLIENNKSGYNGGGGFHGMYINCVIANNEAALAGGVYEPALLEYSTIVNNKVTDNYSAVILFDGRVRYCVIWGNKGGTAQVIKMNSYGTLDYSAIEGGFSGNSTLNLYAANDDTYGPNFVSPSPKAGITKTSGNWNLLSISPLIDRALIDNETPSTDFYGNCRVIGSEPDFGAAEFGTVDYSALKSKRIYVKQGATGNGSSWSNAMGDLNRALFTADYLNVKDVWVAAGSYYPSCTRERWISFNLRDSVFLYGGFSGNELFIEERNIAANPTILSGDIGRRMRTYDNSYSILVFKTINADDTTSINGFVISDAYFEGETDIESNAALLQNAAIENCSFKSNHTNALTATNCKIKNCTFDANNVNEYSKTAVLTTNCTISNCTFTNNHGTNGGALYAENCKITDCIASGNVSLGRGGAFYIENSSLANGMVYNNSSNLSGGGVFAYGVKSEIINSVIYNNTSSTNGGGVYLDSTSQLIASTLVRNYSQQAGSGLFVNNGSRTSVYNDIIWGNKSESNNPELVINTNDFKNYHNFATDDVEFKTTCLNKYLLDTANSGTDSGKLYPRFTYPTLFAGVSVSDSQKVQIARARWSLESFSANIDKGSILKNIPFDIAENIRSIDADNNKKAEPDLGAYESKTNNIVASKNDIVFVSPHWKGTGDGSSWQNARDNIQEAIDTLSNRKGGKIWISQGIYTPVYTFEELTDSGIDLRAKSFYLKPKVNLYGGFDESDTLFSQRNISKNKTILSGLPQSGETRGNLYHVVRSETDCDSTEINGFFITGGVADHFSTAEYKDGGGAYMLNGDIVKCYIMGNTAYQNGGGVVLHNKSRMINCVVSNNYSYRRAGGVYCADSSIVSLSTITNNATGLINGGVETTEKSLISNSIIWNNSAKKDPQINPQANIGFTAVQSASSLTQDHALQLASKNTGNNVDSLYPQYISPCPVIGIPTYISQAYNADWSLSQTSPLINAGQKPSLGIIMASDSTDINNSPRVYNDTVDVGAFEYGAYPIIIKDVSDISLCEEKPVKLSINATGVNIEYQWQYFSVNKWLPIPQNEYFEGINSSNLTISHAQIEMNKMEIRCKIWNSNGTVFSNEITCSVFDLPRVFTNKSVKLCGLEILSVPDSTGYLYHWNTNSTKNSIIPKVSNWYKLTVTNRQGCENSDSIWVTIYKQPEEPFKDSIIKTCAGKPVILEPPVYRKYQWQDGNTSETYVAYKTGIYTLKATDDNGCNIIDSVSISVLSHPATEINIVTYNKSGNAILMNWHSNDKKAFVGHNIYRSVNNSGSFINIDFVDINLPETYSDSSANSVKQSSYSIASIDTCGVESTYSIPHSPLYITANYRVSNRNIVDLNWSTYKGLTYNSYILYKGKTPNSLYPFDTVPSTLQYYTCNVDGYEYYRVGIPLASPVNIGNENYVSSFSNISKISDLTINSISIDSISNIDMIVYPNPSNGHFIVNADFHNCAQNGEIIIRDLIGNEILKRRFENENILHEEFDFSTLRNSIYFITLITDKTFITKILTIK